MSTAARLVSASACLLLASVGAAQIVPLVKTPPVPFTGQAGKDVVWVQTPPATVDLMLQLGKVTAGDYVIDLGSGDGVTVIAAAKKGARALGVEYNPDLVALARRRANEAGVAHRVSFVQGDLFETDLSKATVVTLFLLPKINARLRPKLLALRPGTRIVSNTFSMGDWAPDAKATATPCENWCLAMLWIVPAQAAGTWDLGNDVLTLTQRYQEVYGTLGTTKIANGRIAGDAITFTVGARTYTGTVGGSTMRGPGWVATRHTP